MGGHEAARKGDKMKKWYLIEGEGGSQWEEELSGVKTKREAVLYMIDAYKRKARQERKKLEYLYVCYAEMNEDDCLTEAENSVDIHEIPIFDELDSYEAEDLAGDYAARYIRDCKPSEDVTVYNVLDFFDKIENEEDEYFLAALAGADRESFADWVADAVCERMGEGKSDDI